MNLAWIIGIVVAVWVLASAFILILLSMSSSRYHANDPYYEEPIKQPKAVEGYGYRKKPAHASLH
jgi:hypothetical protein